MKQNAALKRQERIIYLIEFHVIIRVINLCSVKSVCSGNYKIILGNKMDTHKFVFVPFINYNIDSVSNGFILHMLHYVYLPTAWMCTKYLINIKKKKLKYLINV